MREENPKYVHKFPEVPKMSLIWCSGRSGLEGGGRWEGNRIFSAPSGPDRLRLEAVW